MGAALFLVSLLCYFLALDIQIRIGLALAGPGRHEFLSEMHRRGARWCLLLARFFCGFTVQVTGWPRRLPPNCVVVSNHQSLADIPVLAAVLSTLDLRFVAKRELRRRIPAVSLLLRSSGHALISRKAAFSQAGKALLELSGMARRGVSPLIFPEGTRTRTGEVQQFHSAAVRMVVGHTGLPVLAVAVEGGYRIARLMDLARNLRGARYRVRPLTLYPPPKGKVQMRATLDSARAEIVEQIARWRAGE